MFSRAGVRLPSDSQSSGSMSGTEEQEKSSPNNAEGGSAGLLIASVQPYNNSNSNSSTDAASSSSNMRHAYADAAADNNSNMRHADATHDATVQQPSVSDADSGSAVLSQGKNLQFFPAMSNFRHLMLGI